MEITGFPCCFTLPSWFIHTNMKLWKHPRHTARCNWANSPWHCVQRPRSPPDSWPLWRCHRKEVHTQVHLSHRRLDPQKLAGMIRYQFFDQIQYTTWKGSMAQLPLVLVYHSPLLFATELGSGVAPSILSLRCTQMAIPAWTRSLQPDTFFRNSETAPFCFSFDSTLMSSGCGFLRTAETGTGFCDSLFVGMAGMPTRSYTKISDDLDSVSKSINLLVVTVPHNFPGNVQKLPKPVSIWHWVCCDP